STWLALSGELRTARFFGLQADPMVWLPVPVLPAAVVLLSLRGVRLAERWAWAAAGLVFGAFAIRFWGHSPLLVLPAMVLFGAGAALGGTIGRSLTAPSERRVNALLAGFGFAVPASLGVLELVLRTRIP
ncbi:MAG: hypothetical protein ACRDI2_04415, partial [Chloroflexota bacterium]